MSGTDADGLTVEASAKINLYLHVTGRRADGYHELDSLIAFTEEADVLRIEPADTLSLTAEGIFAERLPDAQENLILRAARALADAAGVKAGARIHLTKELPVAAGIGSGSTDAAAALRGLARLWGVDTDKVDLQKVGFTLGADIPACLIGDTVNVGGAGEKLEQGPVLPPAGVLLVNPGVTLRTSRVFEARRGGFSPENRLTETPRDVTHLVELLEARENDLTDAAARIVPVVRELLAALDNLPGARFSRMSGSGATCFALFDDATAAETASELIGGDGWWVRPTRFRTGGA